MIHLGIATFFFPKPVSLDTWVFVIALFLWWAFKLYLYERRVMSKRTLDLRREVRG